MKKILFAASAAGLFAATSAFAQTAEIGTWAGFRKGATSFTFDDGPQNNVDKCLPMFKTYGYNATFNIVVNWANQPSQGMIGWSDVQKLADAGHEIASHSNSHGQNMSGEEASSKKAINDKIKQQYGVITVAYPNCNVPDVNALKQNYIAGRICGNGQEVMSKDGPGDWFKVPAYMTGSTGQYNNTNAFTGAMQQAVNKGGWVMFLTHGFTTGANGWADYSPTDANAIEGALKWAQQNDKDIWVAPMGYVAMYIKERNASKIEAQDGGAAGSMTFKLTHNIKDNISNYDYPLSIRVKYSGSTANVTQAGAKLESKIDGGYVYFDAVPNAGDIVIAGEGGSGPSPESSSSVGKQSSSSTVASSSSRPGRSSSSTVVRSSASFGFSSSSTEALPAEQASLFHVAVYRSSDNYIVVTRAQGMAITVTNSLGQVVRTTRGLGILQKVYTGAKGMYLVKVGGKTFKVSL
jgi:hypothetical protein